MGQKSSGDGPSAAALSLWFVSFVGDLFELSSCAFKLKLQSSVIPAVALTSLSAALAFAFLSCGLIEREDASFLEDFLKVHFLLVFLGGDSRLFFFLPRGL